MKKLNSTMNVGRRLAPKSLLAVAGLLGSLSLASAQIDIPAEWSYPIGSQAGNSEGFLAKTHQARDNAGISATISIGDRQLRDELIDPVSSAPFENLAKRKSDDVSGWPGLLSLQSDFTIVVTNMINYAMDGTGGWFDTGNFDASLGTAYEDWQPPGMPGATQPDRVTYSNGGNWAVEYMGFVELSAGTHTLGVRANDSWQVAMHPNDPRDIFRQQVMGFDSNRGATDTTVDITVEQAGLYAIRLMQNVFSSPGSSEVEFYSVDPADSATLYLLNDRSQAQALKVWHTLSTTPRPYVKSVSPAPDASGVSAQTDIAVVLMDLGAVVPVMRVNGAEVSLTSETVGNETTLTYTPPSFSSGEVVNVEVEYAGATGSWQFFITTGQRALMITGGGALNGSDGWMANRLSTKFGLDVVVVADSAVKTNDADGCVLVLNSATVNSGNVADEQFEQLPIPLWNGEQANADDFLFLDLPYGGKGGNLNNQTQLEIVDDTHQLAAGLGLGLHDVITTPVQMHVSDPSLGAEIVAAATNGRGLIYGIEEGMTVDIDDGAGGTIPFSHPARRVYFGAIGNEGAASFTAAGEALFDVSIEWLGVEAPAVRPVVSIVPAANGNITISWTESGTLHETSNLGAGWEPSSVTNGQTIPVPASGNMFYSIRP